MARLHPGPMPVAVFLRGRPHDEHPSMLDVPLHFNIAHLRERGFVFPRVRLGQGDAGNAWVEEHLVGAEPVEGR